MHKTSIPQRDESCILMPMSHSSCVALNRSRAKICLIARLGSARARARGAITFRLRAIILAHAKDLRRSSTFPFICNELHNSWRNPAMPYHRRLLDFTASNSGVVWPLDLSQVAQSSIKRKCHSIFFPFFFFVPRMPRILRAERASRANRCPRNYRKKF